MGRLFGDRLDGGIMLLFGFGGAGFLDLCLFSFDGGLAAWRCCHVSCGGLLF